MEKQLVPSLEHCVKAFEQKLEVSLEEALALLDLISHLKPHLHEANILKFDVMSASAKLQESIKAFQGNLRYVVLTWKQAKELGTPTWGEAMLMTKMKEAETLIDAAQASWTLQHEQALQEAIEKVKTVVQGNGMDHFFWSESYDGEMGWMLVQNHAEKTLLKIDGKLLEKSLSELQQVMES